MPFNESSFQNDVGSWEMIYRILSRTVHIIFKENYVKILAAHFTMKVPEKGFKIKWVMC